VRDLGSGINKILEQYYTINSRMERNEQDVRDLRNAVQELTREIADMKARIAALEEARHTIRAELRAVAAEVVADLRVQYAEAQAQARVRQAIEAAEARPALPDTNGNP
jgi:chromosome segregation ATPase